MTAQRGQDPAPPTAADFALAALAVALAVVGFVALSWGGLPERVPLHFGPSGAADSYGPRALLWVLALLGLATTAATVGFALRPNFWRAAGFNWPVRITESNAARQARLARRTLLVLGVEVAAVFGFIALGVVRTARGLAAGLGAGPLVVAALLLLTVAVASALALRGPAGR